MSFGCFSFGCTSFGKHPMTLFELAFMSRAVAERTKLANMTENQETHQQNTKTILQQCAQNLLNAVQLLNNSNSNTELPVRSIAWNDGETASQVTNMPLNNRSNILTSPSSRLSVHPRIPAALALSCKGVVVAKSM